MVKDTVLNSAWNRLKTLKTKKTNSLWKVYSGFMEQIAFTETWLSI
jgi:hypothetical protein